MSERIDRFFFGFYRVDLFCLWGVLGVYGGFWQVLSIFLGYLAAALLFWILPIFVRLVQKIYYGAKNEIIPEI